MLCNSRLQGCPIPSTTLWSSLPQVELQQTSACRGACVRLIWPITLSQFT